MIPRVETKLFVHETKDNAMEEEERDIGGGAAKKRVYYNRLFTHAHSHTQRRKMLHKCTKNSFYVD